MAHVGNHIHTKVTAMLLRCFGNSGGIKKPEVAETG
jgi:hypothetical protein